MEFSEKVFLKIELTQIRTSGAYMMYVQYRWWVGTDNTYKGAACMPLRDRNRWDLKIKSSLQVANRYMTRDEMYESLFDT